MLYTILAEDVDDSLERRMRVRPKHLERLKDLQKAGRLVIAGPHPATDDQDPGAAGFIGSLIIAEFDSQCDAQAWADADPYVEAGVYARVAVKPFKQALP